MTGRKCPLCSRWVEPGNHRRGCPAIATPRRTETKEAPVAIKRDLSDLPPADGLTPDPSPRFVGVLVEAWAEEDDDKPTALGTPFRHSDAGKCARALSYTAAGVPRSDPMDITGVWNVNLGTLIHDLWQEALQARWPDAEVEVTCATVGADGSGHIDAVVRNPLPAGDPNPDDYWTTAYELKTMGGRGFAPLPFPLLVAAPTDPGLVAEDVPEVAR